MATAHQKPDRRRPGSPRLEACRRYARARRGRPEPEAKPLPDEPEFNEETKRGFRESMAGEGLVRHDSLDDFFAAHGL